MEPSDDVDDEEKGLNENSSCNGSGDEDNLSDNREEHHIGDNSSPNDHSSLENSDPSQTYDEQQLNDMQAVLPFLKGKWNYIITHFLMKSKNPVQMWILSTKIKTNSRRFWLKYCFFSFRMSSF